MEKTIEMYGGKIYGVTVSDYGIKKGYLDYRTLANILDDCILNNTIRDRTTSDWEIVAGKLKTWLCPIISSQSMAMSFLRNIRMSSCFITKILTFIFGP